MKTFCKIAFATTLTFSVLLTAASCGRKSGEDVDTTKSTIYVGNIDGGVGEDWLKAVKARFEEDYKDYELNGKKGVQVLIQTTKSVAGQNIGTALATLPYEVYFTEVVYYNTLIANKDLLDITDMVQEPMTDYGESKSLEDKINDDYKNYLKVNNKYYGVPHYDASYGLYYDLDMFENFGFYFVGDGSAKQYAKKVEDSFVFSSDEPDSALSSGPNGVVGDYDDGMPATYEQFYALCYKMKENNVVPFTYSGTYSFYCTRLLQTLASAAMGDEANLFFNFTGDTTKLVSDFDGEGNPVITSDTITSASGYKTFQLLGKYNALQFIETLIRNDYVNSKSFATYDNLEAQQDFIKGTYKSTYSKASVTNYGILTEGSWWSNESKVFYDDMANAEYGAGALEKNRRISVMPIPHVSDAEIGQKTSLLCDANLSVAFISNHVDSAKVDLLKEFLQYCYTDVSLSEFSGSTNMLKGVNYEITADDLAKMSHYGKSLIQYRNDCKVVYPFSSNRIYTNYSSAFFVDNLWDSLYGGSIKKNPAAALHNNSKLTAKDYFLGMKENYSKESWERQYQ